MTLVRDAVNVDGRPALAVARVRDGWIREEILLDRQTYREIGGRTVVVRDHRDYVGNSDRLVLKKRGTIDSLLVRTAAKIVDRPGQTS